MRPEEIRTLGFYQPFCSLMFHGKKETRWVRKGRKPPFPLGEYLLYSTKKPCDNSTLLKWCGPEIMLSITHELVGDVTRLLNGTAIGIANLTNVRLMTKEDEPLAFVKFIGEKTEKDKKGNDVTKVQWILEFENAQLFIPFKFEYGKQGVGKYNFNSEHRPDEKKNKKPVWDGHAPTFGEILKEFEENKKPSPIEPCATSSEKYWQKRCEAAENLLAVMNAPKNEPDKVNHVFKLFGERNEVWQKSKYPEPSHTGDRDCETIDKMYNEQLRLYELSTQIQTALNEKDEWISELEKKVERLQDIEIELEKKTKSSKEWCDKAMEGAEHRRQLQQEIEILKGIIDEQQKRLDNYDL